MSLLPATLEVSYDELAFDLSELILDVVDNYQEMFEAMELEVNLDLQNNLIVPGDRLKLRRLFVNLIDNREFFSQTQ